MLGCYRARAVPFNVNQHYQPVGGPRPVRHGRRRGRRSTTARSDRCSPPRSTGAAPCSSTSPTAPATRPLAGQHELRGRRAHAPCPTVRCRSRRPTTSTWCAPAGPPGRPRACCGARPTSSWPRWAAARTRRRRRSADGARARHRHLVRGAAAHARGRAVDRVRRPPLAARRSCSTTTRSRFDARTHPRDREPRAGEPHLDRRRRVRAPDHRRAAPEPVRPRRRSSGSRTGGATTSEATKQALFELLPDVMIIDGYGASETGGMAFGATTSGNTVGRLRAGARARSCSRRTARGFLDAGRRGDRLDRAARPRAARLPRRRRAHRADVPDRRRRAARRARRPRHARAPTARSACSGATPWS